MRRSPSETRMLSVDFLILCSWLPFLEDWQASYSTTWSSCSKTSYVTPAAKLQIYRYCESTYMQDTNSFFSSCWLCCTIVIATATGWRPSVADRGDGVSGLYCGSSCPLVRAMDWPQNALQCHWLMPSSCHFRDCKALLVTSLTYVSGAIASVQTFTFTNFNRMKTSTWLVVCISSLACKKVVSLGLWVISTTG